MIETDLEYLERRAAEETQRVVDSSDLKTAAIHGRLAALYADRVAAMRDNPDYDPIAQTRGKP